jgi:peptidoglycan/LPS O-acetylase OafA/YrhL
VSPPAARTAPFVHGLTSLRAVFIAWVVLYHFELQLDLVAGQGSIIHRGYLGVDGFFLLSGYVLFLQYHSLPVWRPAIWAGFLARRAARIYPGHLAVLAILVLMLAAVTLAGLPVRDAERFRPEDLLKQVLLINAWWTMDQHAWNYVSWALSAEWFGYLLFPVFLGAALAMPRALALPAAMLVLAALAWLESRMGASRLNLTLDYGLCRFTAEFLIGLLLARASPQLRWPFPAVHGAAVIGAAGAATLLLALLPLDWPVVAALGAGILAVHRAEASSTRPVTFRLPLLTWVGSRSYALFITFVLVELPLARMLRMGWVPAEPVTLLVALAIHAAVAELLFRAVETPAHQAAAARLPPLPRR